MRRHPEQRDPGRREQHSRHAVGERRSAEGDQQPARRRPITAADCQVTLRHVMELANSSRGTRSAESAVRVGCR